MRREQCWVAAIAIAQFGIAAAVLGIALAGGGGGGRWSASTAWAARPLSAACVLGGALVVGAALGAIAAGRLWRAVSQTDGEDAAESVLTSEAYALTDETELGRLAATPGGDPFRELLRPMAHLDAVHGAAFSTSTGLTLSARLPQELDADHVSALAPTLLRAAPDWLIDGDGPGVEQEVSIRKGKRSLVVIARGEVLLSALVDETAGEGGASYDWLHATAEAGAKLWMARYGSPS